MRAVPGTPRWAVVCAWLAVATVVPSGIWRTLVGVGVPLGWRQDHLDLERIPGWGTAYVVGLTAFSLVASGLTLGLVRRWGERVPDRVPGLGGRRIPVALVTAITVVGAAAVVIFVVQSVVHWRSVSGFDGRLGSPPAVVMAACYAPMVLWAPLLVAVLVAYVRRRVRPSAA